MWPLGATFERALALIGPPVDSESFEKYITRHLRLLVIILIPNEDIAAPVRSCLRLGLGIVSHSGALLWSHLGTTWARQLFIG